MSARQQFFSATAKSTPSKSTDAGATESGIQSTTDRQEPVALKDASNSPRPERKSVRSKTHNNKNENGSGVPTTAAMQPPASAMSGIDKPLNISSLTRAKPKKATDSQNKRDKNSMVDRLKENEPLSRIRSPRPLPMSPRRLQNSGSTKPHLFNSSNAPLLLDDQSTPSLSVQKQSTRLQHLSAAHLSPSGARHIRAPVALSGNVFAAPDQSLMNGFSPPTSRTSYGEPLEPARREVFPMRNTNEEQAEEAHTFNSLSPPSPHQFFRENRSYDYQAPINVDDGDEEDTEAVSHKHDQRVLRRATKRIGQHDSDDCVLNREGKRTKLDMHSKELVIEQHDDLTYEHPARPSRSSTPTRRYQTPNIQIDPFNSHHTEPGPHSQPNTYVQNAARFGEENQALYRLLGIELDQYLAEHIEQYEAAKKRWTSCTMEEWKAGAEEISGKFSKLVDFVKQHMTTKLTLYATLHDKVAQHKVTLGERRTMLKSVQEKLVKDSGTVLGGTTGGTS